MKSSLQPLKLSNLDGPSVAPRPFKKMVQQLIRDFLPLYRKCDILSLLACVLAMVIKYQIEPAISQWSQTIVRPSEIKNSF